jgi:molecular chaperone HtpG
MTREEAARNLGTIAHSGTLRFLEEAARKEAEGKKPDLALIGQFGVGFYSVFMVAERVDVFSRAGQPGSEAVHWSSEGAGEFTLGPADRTTRGTRIEIHLKEDCKEYLDRFRLEHIVKRYSNFVMYPVRFTALDENGEAKGDPVQLNEIGAFWTRDPKDLTDDDYKDFYRHVMGGFVLPGDEPLGRLHLSLDAPIQFRAVLFVPGRRPADLFAEDSRHLQLFARRVMVMDNCDKLLPLYLRFMRGVVDSEDLPLNVSREMLQENKALAAIRRQLTRKVLRLLEDTAKDDRPRYEKIWQEFGIFLKEGLHIDGAHKDELSELLRFRSAGHDAEWISLREYVDTMKDGQEVIYYITGDSRADLEHSPHLEAVRAKGYAVLLMTDAVDEWVVQDLQEYAGKTLRSVTAGDLDLGDEPPTESKDEPSSAEGGHDISALIDEAKKVLGERVRDVRASCRLTQSASCLVDAEGALGRNMERILKMAGRDIVARPRILELNPKHPFVRSVNAMVAEQGDQDQVKVLIELLHDQANLAEGVVPDPAGTVQRIQAVLDRLTA